MPFIVIPLRAGDIGHIRWHYPVTGSLFDLTEEAPVEGLSTLPPGRSACHGGSCAACEVTD